MIGTLLKLRFRALFAGMTRQGAPNKKGKRAGKGTAIFLCLVYLYLAAAVCVLMAALFSTIVEPYHLMGLDWLYFSMAGIVAITLGIIGTAFTTQNQLYAAKDNDTLLAMPIAPGAILLTRMLPLLALNLALVALVMGTATVVYGLFAGFSAAGIALQLLGVLSITLLCQAVSCLLGWLLHLAMSKINKSFASMAFMLIFFAVYYTVYFQAEKLLEELVLAGEAIAASLRSWVWPIYALGQSGLGNLGMGLAFFGICAGIFALVYWLLSRTFLHAATVSYSAKRKKLSLENLRSGSAGSALVGKELRCFLGTPVYLTNMGIGLLLPLALTVAGVIFRGKVLEFLNLFPFDLTDYLPLVLLAMLAFLSSTNCISTPSVSLEGKSLWILKSMPVAGKTILLGKLNFHLLMTLPLNLLFVLVLGLCYGCTFLGLTLCLLASGLLALLNGLLGMVCGLKWARMDWLSEAYPCKQSASVLVVMLTAMLLPLGLGLLYGFQLAQFLSPTLFLALVTVLLVLLNALLYWLLTTWGVRKWDTL